MADQTATIRFSEETKPAYDASHGTPHAMVRRAVEFDLPRGTARLEQTDYGHPGRYNPWEQRHIDPKLQPKTPLLLAAAEAVAALID